MLSKTGTHSGSYGRPLCLFTAWLTTDMDLLHFVQDESRAAQFLNYKSLTSYSMLVLLDALCLCSPFSIQKCCSRLKRSVQKLVDRTRALRVGGKRTNNTGNMG